jgi:membrane protein
MRWRPPPHLAEFARIAARHDVFGRAAQIAFYGLLALFPGLLAMLGILALLHVGGSGPSVDDLVRAGLPASAAALVLDSVRQSGLTAGWPLVLSAVLSLYYGSRSLSATLRGVELAFSGRYSQVTLVRSGLFGVGLTTALLLLLPLVVLVLTLGGWLVAWFHGRGLPVGPLGGVLGALRWPLIALALQQFVFVLYRLGSGGALRRAPFSIGSACAACAWTLVTAGFEWYVEHFTRIGATYGSLAAVVGLLLYMHVLSSFVLLGGEIDAWRARTAEAR